MTQPAHEFDTLVACCRRCGMRASDVVDHRRYTCIADATNVVAITHVIYHRRLSHMLETLAHD